jgi:2-polyprenyl-3-methyl-5-hydroxy-6-metoxy-1,4-benzoquinol methylase
LHREVWDVVDVPAFTGLRYHMGVRRGGTHRLICDLCPSGADILDVGCASGYLGLELNERGCRVWGVDVDRRALQSVPSDSYEDIREIDLNAIEQLPFDPRQFEVVVAADVLEHLADPDHVLRMLVKALAPGGTLIVSLPNVANFSTRFSLLLGRFNYTETGILDRTHWHLYTFRSARQLLEDAGLDIRKIYAGSDRFGRFLNSSPVILRLLGGLLAYNIVCVGRRARRSPKCPGSQAQGQVKVTAVTS